MLCNISAHMMWWMHCIITQWECNVIDVWCDDSAMHGYVVQNIIKKTNFMLQTKYQFGVRMVLKTEKEVQKGIYCNCFRDTVEFCQFCKPISWVFKFIEFCNNIMTQSLKHILPYMLLMFIFVLQRISILCNLYTIYFLS